MITHKTDRIMEKEKEFTSYTTRVPYFPLVVEKAEGIYVTDIEGNRFIDMMASAAVVNTGHNHPKVVEAIKKQVDKFIHYTPAYMYHRPHTELSEKLAKIVPFGYKKRVAFGLSGSSSVDGAIKVARAFTGRRCIISFFKSYHGTTMGALSVSGYGSEMKRGMGTLLTDIYFIPYPDAYRGFSEEECLGHLEGLFDTVVPAEEVAAIIYEPFQGDGGILIPKKEFYEKLWDTAKKYGILLIADEVQTGFGRTGKMFASEYYDIEPDLVILGKGIASGMPLSALVGRSHILESWSTPVHFFNTAGNAVACAASLATIDILEKGGFLDNVNQVGDYLIKRFEDMMNRCKQIGDVRGKGLFIGVDIVKDQESKDRDVDFTAKLCWRCWEKGLILTFFSSSVLRIEPPLIINMEEAKKAADIIEETFEEVASGLVPDSVLEKIKGW